MDNKIILKVGHLSQPTEWSCGPSSLKIVLDYYGDKINIKKIIKETDCGKEGTFLKGFRQFLKKHRYYFFEKENSNIKDIELFIRKKMPVIVAYQAYRTGHFAVVIGYNKSKLMVSDPAYGKKYKWLNKKDFERRWHGEDKPGKIINRWIMVIIKKR